MNDGKFKQGSKHQKSVLKESDIPEIRKLIVSGKSYQQIGNRYGVSGQAIYSIAKGINWTHV